MSIFSIRSWLVFFLLMTIVSSSYLNKIRPLIGCLLPLLRLSGEAAAGRRRVAALPVPGRAPAAAGHRRRPARRARQRQAALRAPAPPPARRAARRRRLRQPRQVPRRRRADGRAHLQRLRPREGNRAASSFLVNAAAFNLFVSLSIDAGGDSSIQPSVQGELSAVVTCVLALKDRFSSRLDEDQRSSTFLTRCDSEGGRRNMESKLQRVLSSPVMSGKQ